MRMLKKMNLGGILLILFISIFVVGFGFPRSETRSAKKAYIVYLDGKKVGLLENKDTLLNMIDKEQETIKADFGVEKVYPPQGLETIEYTTYNTKVNTAEEIYNLIATNSTFTIKGYTVAIKKDDDETKYINILNKEDLEPALMDAISTFISTENLQAYINDTQVEIVDTGKKIQSIYFEEKITIKESYLPIDADIITNKNDLTKYLLFSTLEPQDEYTVKEGDTIEKVAYNNKLSNEELLIANPNLSSVNALLSPGQKLSIGLISPMFTVVEDSEIIEDVDAAYDTVIEKNSSMYVGQSRVKQEGIKGKNRVTELVQTKNGEIKSLYVTSTTVISTPISKVVEQGTKPSYNFVDVPPAASSTDWGWPTISPYVITSPFGYRWGTLHGGIDISGSGFGSPIYSSTEGTVIRTNSSCPNHGYYGSRCGGTYGNYVEVQTSTGLIIYYAHMTNTIRVSVGQKVTKGQLIGNMGNSGSSTGPHLHFEIRDESGNRLNPCRTAFAC